MAKVTIGGEEKNVPTPYNFRKLKRAWPHMERAANAEHDVMGALDAFIAIVAIGILSPKNDVDDLTDDQKKMVANGDHETVYLMRLAALIDQIEDDLLGPEIPDLKETVFDIMRESGLVRKATGGVEGNAPGMPESPSTETSTESSQNSSQPDALAATGTE